MFYKDPLVTNGMQVFNPTEEMLLAEGWQEWVEPTPTPEELLARAKAEKIAALEAYDSSDSVNSFLVNGATAWINAETRSNYKSGVDSAELLGEQTITFALNGQPLTLPIANAKVMLAQIQRYADNCYMVTLQHKAAIGALTTVEAVNGYDYTVGYPEKLVFNLIELN